MSRTGKAIVLALGALCLVVLALGFGRAEAQQLPAAPVPVPPGTTVNCNIPQGNGVVLNSCPATALNVSPLPFPSLPVINAPLGNWGQVYGPTTQAGVQNAASFVSFFWGPSNPCSGGQIWCGFDVAGYRIGPDLFPTYQTITYLYQTHPDWIVYLNDRATPAYTFLEASATGSSVATVGGVGVLTVGTQTSGTFALNQTITAPATAEGVPGLPAGVTITATSATSGNPCGGSPCTGSGQNNGGTYALSSPITVASTTINAYNNFVPFDFSNPAAQSFVMGQWLAAAAGFSGFSIDNLAVFNQSYNYAGHYVGTTAPCQLANQPACGGTWVQRYTCNPTWSVVTGCSTTDPTFYQDTVNWINYVSAQGAQQGFGTLCNITYNTDPTGTWRNNLVSACSASMEEDVPLNNGFTIADKWIGGFSIDDLFSDLVYNANSAIALRPYFGVGYYSSGDTGNPPTQAAQEYCAAFQLLLEENIPRNWWSCGAIGSNNLPAYTGSMGGQIAATFTGTLATPTTATCAATPANCEITSAANLTGGLTAFVPGLRVTGGGTGCLPEKEFITKVSGTTLTLNAPIIPLSSCGGSGQQFRFSGVAPFPLGGALTTSPQIFPYASPPTGTCGWVNGSSQGVCIREFANGWVFVNPVCQLVSGSCSIGSQPLTIPPTPGSGNWYDMFCNVISPGAYNDGSGGLAAATALIIVYGGSCPVAQP